MDESKRKKDASGGFFFDRWSHEPQSRELTEIVISEEGTEEKLQTANSHVGHKGFYVYAFEVSSGIAQEVFRGRPVTENEFNDIINIGSAKNTLESFTQKKQLLSWFTCVKKDIKKTDKARKEKMVMIGAQIKQEIGIKNEKEEGELDEVEEGQMKEKEVENEEDLWAKQHGNANNACKTGEQPEENHMHIINIKKEVEENEKEDKGPEEEGKEEKERCRIQHEYDTLQYELFLKEINAEAEEQVETKDLTSENLTSLPKDNPSAQISASPESLPSYQSYESAQNTQKISQTQNKSCGGKRLWQPHPTSEFYQKSTRSVMSNSDRYHKQHQYTNQKFPYHFPGGRKGRNRHSSPTSAVHLRSYHARSNESCHRHHGGRSRQPNSYNASRSHLFKNEKRYHRPTSLLRECKSRYTRRTPNRLPKSLNRNRRHHASPPPDRISSRHVNHHCCHRHRCQNSSYMDADRFSRRRSNFNCDKYRRNEQFSCRESRERQESRNRFHRSNQQKR